MLFSPKESASHDQLSRRSQRKTKKIDRDQFAHLYPKHIKSRGRKLHPSHASLGINAYGSCPQLTTIPSAKNEQYLLTQMSKAFQEQNRKLYDLLKIKLQLGQEPPAQPHSTMQMDLIEEELDSLENQLLESESSPQGVWLVQLKRTQSAKMLCDNYQNHELIYSVETLTPRLAKEDIDFRFIEQMQ